LRLSTAENNQRLLIIQTNVSGKLYVWLTGVRGNIQAAEMKKIEWHGSEHMLALIDRLLGKKKVQLESVVGIIVVRGPGPFTAVRTGLVIANTLGTILKIPVKGVVSDQPLSSAGIRKHIESFTVDQSAAVVRPWYGKEPNITTPTVKQKKPRSSRGWLVD